MSNTIIRKAVCSALLAGLFAFFPLIGAPISASADGGPNMGKANPTGMYKATCNELQSGTVICTIRGADKGKEVKVTCAASKDIVVLACLRDVKQNEIRRTFQIDIPKK